MIEWTIVTTKDVEKRLAAIPNPQRQRISDAIDTLKAGPHHCGQDVKPLTGRPEWRLRVGRWRILFLVDNGTITITVVGLGARGDVYKDR